MPRLQRIDPAVPALPWDAGNVQGARAGTTTLFTELRELLFATVTLRAVRRIALEVFRHPHEISPRGVWRAHHFFVVVSCSAVL